jgi:hypothetical protein
MLIFTIILLLFLSIGGVYLLDPDFGWRLHLGKKMVENHQLIQNYDGYNVFEKLKIIDHEWLTNLLYYLSYDRFGYIPLLIISFLAAVLVAWLLYRVAEKRSTPVIAIIATFNFLLAFSAVYFGVRPQLLLFLGVGLMLYIKTFVPDFRRRLILYFILFLIGNNLHGGFLVLSIIPLFLETDFSKLFQKNLSQFWQSLSLLIIILLGVSITPYGLDYWRLVFEYGKNTFYLTHIREWLPIYYSGTNFIGTLIPGCLVVFLLIIEGYWRKIKPNELILLIILFVAGVQARRMFPIFIMVATPYIAASLKYLLEEIFKIKPKDLKLITPAIFLLLCVCFFPKPNCIRINQNPFINNSQYPAQALEVLEEQKPSDGILFNHYGWGGYIVWTHPEIPVFIDGRGPQGEIKPGLSILQEYFNILDNKELMKQKIVDYNITSVLLDKKEYKKQSSTFYDYLKQEKDWQTAYEDENSVLFIKKL